MAYSKVFNYMIRLVYILIDVVFISVAILLACQIRAATLPFEVTPYNLFFAPENPFRFLFVSWLVILIFSFQSKRLYQTKRGILEGFEIAQILQAVMWASVVVIVALYALKIEKFPRSVFFIGTGFIFLFVSVWRFLKRKYVEYIVAKGFNNFNTIIIGAGRVGVALANEITKKPSLGVKIVGFLDDFKTTALGSNYKILGKIDDFKTIAPREFIDKVFITLHHDSRVFLKLLEEAKELGVAVRVIPQGFDLMPGEFTKYNIGIIPVLEYCDNIPLRKQVGKRIFDLLVTFIAFLILAPVFVIISILIRLDSPGPALYISKRYGRNGRIFNMYKFRSMRIDADKELAKFKEQNEVDGPIFKIKNDPRVTRMGRFLRKYSLDELPQIINVLQGRMSLVGPRPLPIDQIEKEDLQQLKRLEVRPGITGLWQIRGRSDISFKRLIRWDMWYINNWSLWLDLNILFQTVPVVLHAKGAY